MNDKLKIGICFGGYNPMHQGHLDVIMRSKKECDYTFVVVCGYENEPRAIVNFNTKVDIVAKFIEANLNDTNVHHRNMFVTSVNDTELGIDESESDSNWDIWLADVYKKIRLVCMNNGIGGWGASFLPKNSNVHFYVGEERYVEALKKRKIKVTLVGKDKNGNRLNDISGTAIRNNPIKYWHKIIPPYRPYMTKRILITGTASEGKTTLVQDLGIYFDTSFVVEQAKSAFQGFGSTKLREEDLTKQDYISFLNGQYYEIIHALNEEKNKGFIFSDTDGLVTLMYAKSYSAIPSFKITEDDCKEIEEYYDANYTEINKWDKIFLIVPHGKFVDDGIRYMGQSSLDERFKNYYILLKLLAKYNMMDKVMFLNGTYYENFETVKKYVNNNIISQ